MRFSEVRAINTCNAHTCVYKKTYRYLHSMTSNHRIGIIYVCYSVYSLYFFIARVWCFYDRTDFFDMAYLNLGDDPSVFIADEVRAFVKLYIYICILCLMCFIVTSTRYAMDLNWESDPFPFYYLCLFKYFNSVYLNKLIFIFIASYRLLTSLILQLFS